MPIWWWLLVTFHMVCGKQETLEDLYDIDISPNNNYENPNEDVLGSGSSYIPVTAETRRKRRSLLEERDSRQQKFHSWGGKRYEEDDEEDSREDEVQKDNPRVFLSPSNYILHAQLNYSEGKSAGDEEYVSKYSKRMTQNPAFSSWAGKRDPEVLGDINKRSDLYNSILRQGLGKSLLSEQNIKRYPAFNSWAGKRSAAFNSWGGKRAAAFNSWGGKRASPFNSWGGKRAAAFNSWGGKRAAAFNSWGGKREPAFNSWAGKRAAAFNSWGGKRAAAFNSWGGKRAASFNSWGGKRAAAFNSWGGKRTAAFNSWGGKREPAFNSWAGKRAAAFNSWGGKRAAAFNSWGGKRAAAFNSWGGKRTTAFNSWGGKRAAAFNSWGGKREPAFNSWAGKKADTFNSWGGKRGAAFNSWDGEEDRERNTLPLTNSNYNDNVNTEPDVEHLSNQNLTNLSDRIFNQEIISGGNDNSFGDEKSEEDSANFSNRPEKYLVSSDKLAATTEQINSKFLDQEGLTENRPGNNQCNNLLIPTFKNTDDKSSFFEHDQLNKRNKKDYFKLQPRYPGFSSWAGKRNYEIEPKEVREITISSSMEEKRSPLFSNWYGNKIPTVQLSNGKRRPAFSSWGGKRSEFKEQHDCSLSHPLHQDCITDLSDFGGSEHSEENPVLRRKRDTTCLIGSCRDKRSNGSVKKNPAITRMLLQGGVTWPMIMKSLPRGSDFYAWGGKRSS